MSILATLRQQPTRARTALGLLLVVCLSVAILPRAGTAPDTESSRVRTVADHGLALAVARTAYGPADQCPICPDCEHERCVEQASCDGPILAGTKAEVDKDNTSRFELIAAAAGGEFDAAFTSRDTSPGMQLSNSVTAAVISIAVRYRVRPV